MKSSRASDETLSPVTVQRTSSLFLLKPCIEQLPPTIANCSDNSPHLPIVIACAPSEFYCYSKVNIEKRLKERKKKISFQQTSLKKRSTLRSMSYAMMFVFVPTTSKSFFNCSSSCPQAKLVIT